MCFFKLGVSLISEPCALAHHGWCFQNVITSLLLEIFFEMDEFMSLQMCKSDETEALKSLTAAFNCGINFRAAQEIPLPVGTKFFCTVLLVFSMSTKTEFRLWGRKPIWYTCWRSPLLLILVVLAVFLIQEPSWMRINYFILKNCDLSLSWIEFLWHKLLKEIN